MFSLVMLSTTGVGCGQYGGGSTSIPHSTPPNKYPETSILRTPRSPSHYSFNQFLVYDASLTSTLIPSAS